MRSRRHSVHDGRVAGCARAPRWRAVWTWLGLGVALLVTAPTLAAAQSTVTVDAYLHGSGGTANPPTLTADLLPASSSTTKTQDSASVAFTGGNPWKVIGSWVPPAGSSASIKLNAFTTSHLWLGLKASGDVGGKIDLLAEIVVNGQVLSAGTTRCLSTLTASASTPQDIATTFSAIPVTTVNPATDTLAIRYSARMGTNTDGTACGTKTSVTGVRAYFDSSTRLSRVGITLQLPPPTPVALLPNPQTIHAGATGTVTAILFPAPLQAGTLTVTSSNPAVATVPASVPVGTLQFLVPITVTGVSAGTSVITATMNGKSALSTVRVVGGAATITSLTPPALSITQGGTGTLTVTINAIQSANTVVSLTSSATSIAAVPASVTVLAGQTTASVPVAANTVGQADITASLNGTTATSHITVTSVLPTVVALLPPTSQVTLGASGTLTVKISAAQASNTTVTLAASLANIVTLPPTVIVPANQLSATFPITGVALGTTMVTASLNGSSVAAAVDVMPPAVQLTDLQPPTQQLVVGAIGTLTVSLNAQQTSPTVITLTNTAPTILQVPPTVTVQPGQTQANFTVTALTTGTATITATLGTVTKQATVTVIPQPPQVTALIPTTLAVVQGATGSLTLRINAAQPTNTIVPLTKSSATILDVPLTVTIPAGFTEAPVQVTGLTMGTATVTATLNGTVTSTITVVPPPVTITALGPVPPTTAPLTLAKGRAGVLRVTVNRVPTVATVVTVSNAQPNLVTVFGTVTVEAGAPFADFPVTTQNEGTATITASLNSTSANAQVVVTAPEVDALTLLPLAPSLFAGEAISFVATATMTDGTTQPLTSNLTWTSSNTTVATIDSTGLATTLTAGTTTIKAATTNSLGPVTGDTLLTVQPAPALALAPVSGTLAVGQSLNLVVTSAAPAGSTGLTVHLVQAGTGSVTMVPTTIIPANGTTNSVVITGATFGQVTITASAVGRLPATATFTMTPAAPTIAGFTPITGPVGTVVTITGTNLNGSGPGSTTVKFKTTNAIITSVSATSLTTTVPQGATTGLVTVTTPGGTAISAQPFTVTTSQDFSLTVAPVALSVVQGRPITTQVQLANTGSNPVTGFVALAATGLPTGMTGTFIPSQIAGGQTATLTLNSGTAPAGPVTITVTATTVVDGQTIVRQSPLTITVLAAGGTTLAGRILATKDDAPIPGARVKVGALSAITDASGNFLLTAVPTGPQVLLIDGPSALYPADLPVPVTITPNVANTLSYPVYLHEVSHEYFPLIPGQATVIQPPDIPDFSMIVPAGTTIMGWDNQPNTRVSVTRVPIDRLPLPPIPPDVSTPWVYMFNFGKAGGGYPNRPIPIVFPNETNSPPGTRVDLWYYDESPTPDVNSNQWKIYGQGTVSEDGRQIVPDPGVGQPKFCCGGGFPAPPRDAKGPGTDTLVGEPVSASTGMFHLEVTDLVLPGRIPVVIKRGYRSQIVPPVFPTPRRFPRTLVNLEEFGINTALLEYNDRLTISAATAFYTTGFERSLLTRNTDGTYTSNRVPFLRGLIVRVNQDGTSTLREKNGTVRTFGSDGWLQRITDRNGNTVTIVRNGSQIQQIIEPGGRALTFTYNGGKIAQITDPIGRTVTYTYEVNPAASRPFTRLTEVANPANGSTRYTYSSEDCIAGITDARGIRYLTNEYIPLATEWAVSRQTQADGGVWQFNYVLNGLSVTQATITDSRGDQMVNRFNGLGFNLGTTSSQGQVTRFSRDFRINEVTEIRDPLNRLTKYTYDLQGNVNSIIDPQGNPTIFEYEPTFNRVTRITNALNQNTRFTYDPVNGNLLSTVDPLNHATTIAYNQFGQPVSVTDALNHTTTFEYDDVGNLIATIDPFGNRTFRFYDVVSRLIALVDPQGKEAQFTYDALNRVTQIQDAINGITAFTYDPKGNVLTLMDAKNQTTTYTYDNMDRLATRKDALNRMESYQYDLASNLTQFTDRKNQTTTFTYDSLNRRIGASYADGSSTSFTYDSVGRQARATDSIAGTVEFTYDNLNRLSQETTAQGTVTYQYDVLGRRTAMTANGATPVSYGYDAASRLTQVTQAGLVVGLSYDAAGRRTSLTYPNGTDTSYSYDNASRLTAITHNGPAGLIESLGYTYDAAGNRILLTRTNGTASNLPAAVQAGYDAANEQVTFNSLPSAFDANGNLTINTDATGTTTYTWDARNRLIAQAGPGVSSSFVYDALGRRVSATINGQNKRMLYDGNDIVQEIGESALGASYVRSLNIDEPFVRQTSTGNEYYHTDALGSTLGLTNQSGAVQASYYYEAFGKTMMTGASSNSFQYTGRENDGTGLFYYRARYYSSTTERFLQEDLFKWRSGVNLYTYTYLNPIRLNDPLGLEPNFFGVCGSSIVQRIIIPDGYGPYSFANACQNHDDCYGKCGPSKTECDDQFYINMMETCQKLTGSWAQDCSIAAVVYYAAVDSGGKNAYQGAQQKCQGSCGKDTSTTALSGGFQFPKVY